MPLDCSLVLACPEPFRTRARWVFRNWSVRYDVAIVLVERIGDAPEDRHLIVYGDAAQTTRPHLRIPHDPTAWGRPPDASSARWVDYRGQPLLDLWGNAAVPVVQVHPSESVVRVGMDIVAAVFHVLSGASEHSVSRLDRHSRVPHDASLVGRLGLTHRPVVDAWFGVLSDGLEALVGQAVPRRNLWQGAPFAVCLTHDIDRVHRGWVDASKRAMREALAGRWQSAFDTGCAVFRRLASGADFYWNLDDLLRIGIRYGARPSFFLMAGAGHPLDADYRLNGRWTNVVHRIVHAGGEIGLHGSYESFRRADLLRRERREIERLTGEQVVGMRQHFLRFDPRRTWQAQAEAGLRYDATVGFVEHVGFRAGTCFPYQAYDVPADRPLPLTEIPLLVMDRTLEEHLKLSPRQAWDALQPILSTVERSGGCLTVLWHNLFVVDACYPGWRAVYERMLDWARQRGAWLTTGAEVWRSLKNACALKDNNSPKEE